MSKKNRENRKEKTKGRDAVHTPDKTGGEQRGERLGHSVAIKRAATGQVTDRATPQTEEARKMVGIMNEAKAREQELVKELLGRTNGEFPKKERELIDCYFFEDLPEEDIQKRLSISPDTFWELLESINSKFKEMLPPLRYLYNA